MTGWTVVAYGKPEPQGSKTRNRHGGVRDDNPKTTPWKQTIQAAALAAREAGAQPIVGPVAVRVVFTVRRPSGARKVDRFPSTRPDLDKYLRAVFDALTDAGMWEDDARVAEVTRLAKVWPGHDDEALSMPGVLVMAESLELGFVQGLRADDGAVAAERERRRLGGAA